MQAPLSAIRHLLFVCFFLSCFRVSTAQYTMTLQRLDSTKPNLLTLTCRNTDNPSSGETYTFWVNATSSGVQNIRSQTEDSLLFAVTKETEGEYFCRPVGQSTLSNRVPIIVRPTQDLLLEPVSVRVWSGTTAVLNPLVQPGNWHSRYQFDWVNASSDATVERIDGLRSFTLEVRTDRYSVDERNFSLIIESVSRSDAGDFLGVLGVRAVRSNMDFTYEQTRNLPVSLIVSDPPSIIQKPLDQVISHGTRSSINFTCIARGYPRPTITWYRNMIEVSLTSAEYQEYSENIGDDTIMSTLIKSNLIPQDSGTFACKGTVEPGGDIGPISETAMAELSVLEIANARVDLTTTGDVIFTVYLAANVSADLRLKFYLRNSLDEEMYEFKAQTVYSHSDELTYFLPNARYQHFTVDIAVIHGAVQSPFFTTPVKDINSLVAPDPYILHKTLIPSISIVVIVAMVIVMVVIIVSVSCYCKKVKNPDKDHILTLLKYANKEQRKIIVGREMIKLGYCSAGNHENTYQSTEVELHDISQSPYNGIQNNVGQTMSVGGAPSPFYRDNDEHVDLDKRAIAIVDEILSRNSDSMRERATMATKF